MHGNIPYLFDFRCRSLNKRAQWCTTERERDNLLIKERKRERDNTRTVCVCVCVRERERERERGAEKGRTQKVFVVFVI